MLKRLKNRNIFKSRSILGVNCYLESDGTRSYTYILLLNKRGNIEIEKTGCITELESFFKMFSSTIPICISFDGKGVLYKKITNQLSQTVLHQVIPNANEDEFYHETFQGNFDNVIVSVARRDTIQDILKLFTNQNRYVISLTLGPFNVAKLKTLFPDLPSTIISDPYEIKIEELTSSILNYRKLVQEDISENIIYKLGSSELTSKYLLPYFSALSYFLPEDKESGIEEIKFQRDEFAFKRIFSIVAIGSIILIFIILLLNLGFYFNFSDQKQQLETKITGNEQILVSLKKLNDEVTWKEKFLSQAGIIKNSRLSYFADQIAESVPFEINLLKMELHPVLSKVKKLKEIELAPDEIRIDGTTPESELLNDWTQILKKMKWVKDVSVTNYLQDNNSSVNSFSVVIHLN